MDRERTARIEDSIEAIYEILQRPDITPHEIERAKAIVMVQIARRLLDINVSLDSITDIENSLDRIAQYLEPEE